MHINSKMKYYVFNKYISLLQSPLYCYYYWEMPIDQIGDCFVFHGWKTGGAVRRVLTFLDKYLEYWLYCK